MPPQLNPHRSIIGLSLVLLASAPLAAPARAWGPEGHQITAAIAEAYLHEQTKAGVQELLGRRSLVDIANWADEVRDRPAYEWTKPLHYINVPRGAARVEMDRDCRDGGCVLGAIEMASNVLRNSEAPPRERAEALMFLVHFVGDVHQPMHVAYRDDLGGNQITTVLFGEETNLHRTWDTGLIRRRITTNWHNLAREIHGFITPQHLREWSSAHTPISWANESLTITRRIYEELPRTAELGQEYYDRNIGDVQERLAMGGVRIAMALNAVFAPDLPPIPLPEPPEAPPPVPEAIDGPEAPQPEGSEAAAFVAIILDGECGEGGQFVHAQNNHESKRIEVTLRRSWRDRDREMSAESVVVLRPGEGNRRRLGCSNQRVGRGEVREFTWEIVGAEFK